MLQIQGPEIILGVLFGISLGWLLLTVFVSVILFISTHIYEKKISSSNLIYLNVLICLCAILVLMAVFSLFGLFNPRSLEATASTIQSIWISEYSWRAILLSSFVVFCASISLFLVGPFEMAQRVRLRLAPITKNSTVISDNLTIKTTIPARLDRLPWGSFHTVVVVGLGITWILNGVEVSLASTLWPAIQHSFGDEVSVSLTTYIFGLVIGALVFGWLTDRLGRKRLFFVTLLIYLSFTALTGLSQGPESLALFRFLTGVGIGGEYAAINSTIQELIPAKFRGRTDLLVGGTFWIGAAIGASSSTVFLDPTLMRPEYGWRIAFLTGAVLAIIVLGVRRAIPESPRWLMTHNRVEEAEAIVSGIEEKFHGRFDANAHLPYVHLLGRSRTPLLEVIRTVFRVYPERALVSFSLMAAQALVYNAIYFTYQYQLTNPRYFGIPQRSIGWYLIFFAAGNFMGPLILARLFDTRGRKRMIGATYLIAGVLILVSGYLVKLGAFSALTLSLAWMVTFFFASAAASAAYLTAGETFPLEIRAMAIAFFFAIGTAVAAPTPVIFQKLIERGPASLYLGYITLATLMIMAGLIGFLWGVRAERRPLEDIARPLTFVD